MNKFLWVEDFSGKNPAIATVNDVFGSLVPNLSANDNYDWREELEEHGIF